MKKFLFGLLAAVMLISVGCSSDNDGSSQGSASITVEGKTYNFTNVYWVNVTLGSSTTYTISPLNNENDFYIVLSDKKTGEIALGTKNSVEVVIGTDNYTSVSGSFSITKFDDKKIEGSFNGSFVKGKDLTQTFKISGKFTSSILSLGL